jgi:hypothetical protein
VIHREAFAAQHPIEQWTTPSAPLFGQRPRPLTQFCVAIRRARTAPGATRVRLHPQPKDLTTAKD